MKQLQLFFIGLAVLTIAGLAIAAGSEPASPAPVLAELFTSEGCSSCPPADRVLETLDQTQPVNGADIIVLGEHVDYWDEGGWKDRFSSPQFTRRQTDYARQFHLASAYTPQLVVDGQAELVGSRAAEARDLIAKAAHRAKLPVRLDLVKRSPDTLSVNVGFAPWGGSEATVYVALAESHAQSKVGGGENSGRVLQHVAAVRALIPAGTVKSGAAFSKQVDLNIPPGAARSGLRVVAFVQERSGGRVLGVTQLEL